MAAVRGEARRLQYKPGEAPPREAVPDEGEYDLKLVPFKKGLKGWKAKTGKFPYRMVRFELLGTENEVSGKPFTVPEVLSTSPGAAFRITALMHASQYPEEIDITMPNRPGDNAGCKEYCNAIDNVLQYLEDQDLVLKARITHEEYNGDTVARIKRWLTGDELEAQSDVQSDEESEEEPEEEEVETEEEVEVEEEGEEVEAEDAEATPAPASRKKAAAVPAKKNGKK